MQPPSPPSRELHQRLTRPDDDELDPVVAQLGDDCGRLYAKLEECLGENDRDWRACQKEVQALKACYETAKKPSSPPPGTK